MSADIIDLHPEPTSPGSPGGDDDPQRRAADPAASVWVAASAGTGKTKVLTDRVLALLLAGTAPQRILCLTFTRAAAAEMSNRIAETLGAWAASTNDDLAAALAQRLGRAPSDGQIMRARTLFARVLEAPGRLNIQTIHAFCQSLLGRFPIEAGVAPHFRVMDERDASEMLHAAREQVLTLADRDGNKEGEGQAVSLAEALARVTAHVHETGFPDLMTALIGARGRLRRLIGLTGPDQAVAKIRRRLGLDDGETAETFVVAACADDAIDGDGLRRAAEALAQGSATDQGRGADIAAWLTGDPAARREGFATYTAVFLTQASPPVMRKTLITKAAAEKSPAAIDVLASEAERLLATERKRRAAVTAQATEGLLILGDALLDAYTGQKERAARLDYDDLILIARTLVADSGAADWVLFKLDGGIDHVLIDEAQDTNPDQWRVVTALADEFFAGAGGRDEARTVFAVGDVKQSIFSFQGADPTAFDDTRGHFSRRVSAANGLWSEVPLNRSFRSTRAVLAAVDAVFADPAVRDGVSLDQMPITHEAARHDAGGLVEVWPAIEADVQAAPVPWKPPVERVIATAPSTRLAHLIAARIEAMVAGDEILESKGRPVRAGDVMVLVRRRGPFVDDLVRALKERGVEVAGVDRMVLTDQMAVMDLIALGRFLLFPDDDLTLATVLKGPLFALDEKRLFDLAHDRPGALWRSLRDGARNNPDLAAVADELSSLLAAADFTPPFELFADILGARDGRRRLLARLGPDAEDPIAEFLDLALDYERGHAASLQGFLHWLEIGAVEVKRDPEHGARDAVRVLTVHGAKGLQAPIVFLPDTLQAPRAGETLLWPEADDGTVLLWPPGKAAVETVAEAERERLAARRDEEYRRLLYVAMTRAEDRLYVAGWHTRNKAPDGCWYNLIRSGLDGIAEAEKPAGELADAAVDEPILRLSCPQEGAAIDDGPLINQSADRPALPDWATQSAPAEADPPRPLAPSRPDGEEPAVRSPFGDDDGARFKRGRLVHRLLQGLPDVTPERRRDAARAWLSRPVHDLNAAAVDAITDETLAVLETPEFAPLFGPGSQAEVPFVGRVGAHVLSGQIDRLAVTDEAVIIVDYKTNRPPPGRIEDVSVVYLKQMAAYRAALKDIYRDREIVCHLLWTEGPRLMTLPDDVLENHAP